MTRRSLLFTPLAVIVMAPFAPGGELAKYIPSDTTSYVHIQPKQALAAPMPRKLIPLVFAKYGDQLGQFLQLAQQMVPNAQGADLGEVKKQIKTWKDPKVIADAFDAAKQFAPEIIIAGSEDDPEAAVFLIKADGATPEGAAAIAKLAEANGAAVGLKVKIEKKGKFEVYELELPQQDHKLHMFLPEAGIICVSMGDESLAAVLDLANGKKKSKLDKGLVALITQRKPTDFAFFAGSEGEGDDKETHVGSVDLAQDLTVAYNVTCANTKKAKEKADEFNNSIASALDSLASMADSEPEAKPYYEMVKELKAKTDGKLVTVDFKLETAKIEKTLKIPAKKADE